MKPTTPADASLAAAKASAKGKTTVQGGAPVRMSEATPAGRRKKRKASDKQTMEQVANFIPESALYNRLLDLERKLDVTFARKRTHIQEALQKPERVTCKLRMYVFNAYSAGSATSGDTPTPPTWTLFICGRLVDIPTPGSESGAPGSGPIQPVLSEDHRFTKLIKRVSISLDPQQYPEDNNIVWESEKNVLATDGFEWITAINLVFPVATIRLVRLQ
ncbi:hypothetical protein CYMTET_26437 [Cymbomonas tetramitiformis]|uniref:Uncharacterized protein n=1 Tax=Cymbomonas tetramitiformis TaxID=36881 RepID=A0AAE0FS98_9CHLO|nr:hypothetical protein CYMTET_26437 [Cymbomonas tetramitiformis]